MLTARNVELDVVVPVPAFHLAGAKVHPMPVAAAPEASPRSLDSKNKQLKFAGEGNVAREAAVASPPQSAHRPPAHVMGTGSTLGMPRLQQQAQLQQEQQGTPHVPDSPAFVEKRQIIFDEDDQPYDCDQSSDENASAWLPLILPTDERLKVWTHFIMCSALFTAFIDPYRLSFVDWAGIQPYTDAWAVFEYLGVVIFAVDLILKFFVPYVDPQHGLEVRHSKIAAHYLKGWFWIDLLTTVPFDGIVAAALGIVHRVESPSAMCLGLVRWLRLARLYRIFVFFEQLEHAMIVSQATLIIGRNFLYVILTTHWFACLVYWLGALEQMLGVPSWLDRAPDRWDGLSVAGRYVNAVYFSVSAFAGLGDSDFYASSVPEGVAMVIYLFFNIVLTAYILGTITMVVVKGDESSRLFRERMEALRVFSSTAALPEPLVAAMREHLELQSAHENRTDDHILADYPPVLRIRALRHLYGPCLVRCSLFQGIRGRFLDQLLSSCRSEIFMPHVALLNGGDAVSDLIILLEGTAQAVPAEGQQPDLARMRLQSGLHSRAVTDLTRTWAQSRAARKNSMQSEQPMAALQPSSASFFFAGTRESAGLPRSAASRSLGPQRRASTLEFLVTRTPRGGASRPSSRFDDRSGDRGMLPDIEGARDVRESDVVGAVPFFTDTASRETVFTTSIVRVILISRTAFDALTSSYPEQTRLLYENLQQATQQDLVDGLRDTAAAAMASGNQRAIGQLQAVYGLLNRSFTTPKSARIAGAAAGSSSDLLAEVQNQLRGVDLSPAQHVHLQHLAELHRVVGAYMRKQHALKLYEMLLAAAAGDVSTVKELLSQGVRPKWADYDGRTALIVAAHEGQDAVIRMLLSHGAPVDAVDAHGNTALSEAVMQGHERAISLLVAAGATLGMDEHRGCTIMCQAIARGDVACLQRLLRTGANPTWRTVEGTTPLHVAAAEGSLHAVEALVHAGAIIQARNRHGSTPMDEARAAGHTAIMEALESMSQSATEGFDLPWQQQRGREGSTSTELPLIDELSISQTSNVKSNRTSKSSRHGWRSAQSTPKGIGSYRGTQPLVEDDDAGVVAAHDLLDPVFLNTATDVIRKSLDIHDANPVSARRRPVDWDAVDLGRTSLASAAHGQARRDDACGSPSLDALLNELHVAGGSSSSSSSRGSKRGPAMVRGPGAPLVPPLDLRMVLPGSPAPGGPSGQPSNAFILKELPQPTSLKTRRRSREIRSRSTLVPQSLTADVAAHQQHEHAVPEPLPLGITSVGTTAAAPIESGAEGGGTMARLMSPVARGMLDLA